MYPPFKEKGGFPSTTATALARLQLDSPNGDGLPTGNLSTESIHTEEEGEIDTISSRCASLLRGKCKPPNTMDIYTSALSGLYLGLLAEINPPSALPLGSHSTQIASSLLCHKALTLVVIERGLSSYFQGPTWSVVVRKISCPQVG